MFCLDRTQNVSVVLVTGNDIHVEMCLGGVWSWWL